MPTNHVLTKLCFTSDIFFGFKFVDLLPQIGRILALKKVDASTFLIDASRKRLNFLKKGLTRQEISKN